MPRPAPTIDELAVEFDGQVTVGKVNVDDNPHLAAQYGIRSIPTVLLFKEGQVVDQTVGVVSKQVLAEKLARLCKLRHGAHDRRQQRPLVEDI